MHLTFVFTIIYLANGIIIQSDLDFRQDTSEQLMVNCSVVMVLQ